MEDGMAVDTTFLEKFSALLGASEPSLRLLLSLLASYPLLYLHQQCLKSKPNFIQHLYFILCGIGIALFNNGFSIIHSVISILFAWITLLLIGGSLLSVVISFLFHMGYLLIGYYYTGTDTYDIKWTMPHCVLTLRLIALSFDLFDGNKNKEKLSVEEAKSAISRKPSLLEIAAHTYFPASYMVGPQFSMKRYIDFINCTLYPPNQPPSWRKGLVRGFWGLVYLCIYQVGNSFLPDSYLLSDSYMSKSFLLRFFIVALWGKILLYKYISCWLITEGACICSGLAYSGLDEKGDAIWKGCSNIRVYWCETALSFGVMIQGFNINTNAWVAKYVYKRLKFLNNRLISQYVALVFLALWHGFHSGYYACFFMEFIVMYMEKRLSSVMSKYPEVVATLNSKPLCYLLAVIMKLYVFLFMGYCLGSFALLKSSRWIQFYKSLYFVGHIFFLGWIPFEPVFKICMRKIFGSSSDKKIVSKKDDANESKKEL